MIAAARWPRERPEDERLLWIDPGRDALEHRRVGDLPAIVRPGDLVVVNDAATLPASLRALREDGKAFEVRLLAHEGSEPRGPDEEGTHWRAVLFGRGDWRQRTEDRPPPPRLLPGERIRVAGGVAARVLSVDDRSPRLVRIAFEVDAPAMWRAIYDEGRPVQYAYIDGPLALWHVQSPFAARPWAVEAPSAGRPLTYAVRRELRRRGVAVAALTHAAGLSSSGDPALDALLPLDERYDIPAATANAVELARREGRRVIAVGTTVVRALEGCAASTARASARSSTGSDDGAPLLVAGEASTDLRLGARSRLRVVSGLLTGVHEPPSSHFELMRAFASDRLLSRALECMARGGYLQHEFGDSILVLPYDGARLS